MRIHNYRQFQTCWNDVWRCAATATGSMLLCRCSRLAMVQLCLRRCIRAVQHVGRSGGTTLDRRGHSWWCDNRWNWCDAVFVHYRCCGCGSGCCCILFIILGLYHYKQKRYKLLKYFKIVDIQVWRLIDCKPTQGVIISYIWMGLLNVTY